MVSYFVVNVQIIWVINLLNLHAAISCILLFLYLLVLVLLLQVFWKPPRRAGAPTYSSESELCLVMVTDFEQQTHIVSLVLAATACVRSVCPQRVRRTGVQAPSLVVATM